MEKELGARIMDKAYLGEAKIIVAYYIKQSNAYIPCHVSMMANENKIDCRILNERLGVNIQTSYGKNGIRYKTIMDLKRGLMRTLDSSTGRFSGMLVVDNFRNILYDQDPTNGLKLQIRGI